MNYVDVEYIPSPLNPLPVEDNSLGSFSGFDQAYGDDVQMLTATAFGMLQHPKYPNMKITIKAEEIVCGDQDELQERLMKTVKQIVDNAKLEE